MGVFEAMLKKDHLSNKLSISANLEERAVSINVKSRAIAAFDRLLGSVMDIPAAYMENFSARARAKGKIEVARLVETPANSKSSETEEAIHGYLASKATEDQAEKIENLAKVTNKSVQILIEQSGDSDFDQTDTEIDPDWLNVFRRHSEDVTTERMQEIWGLILAGEIKNPSSYSLSTLRVLSEMDRELAELFQERSKLTFGGVYIPRPLKLAGKLFSDFSHLEDAGLLSGVTGQLHFSPASKNISGPTFIKEGNYVLECHFWGIPSIQTFKLTRVGTEILSILPKPNPCEALKALFESVNNTDLKSAKIHLVTEHQANGRPQLRELEVLKAA